MMKITKTENKKISILKRFMLDTQTNGKFKNIKDYGMSIEVLTNLGLVECVNSRNFKWVGGEPTVDMVRDSYALHCINKNIDLKNRTHINLFTVDLHKISKLSTKKDNKKTEKVEKKSVVTIKKVSNRSTKKSSISNNDLMLLRESLNLISDDNRFIEFIKDCKDINENDPYHVVRSKYHTISRKYKISDVEKYRNICDFLIN